MFDTDFIDRLAQAITPRLAELLYPRLKVDPVLQQEWLNRQQAARYIGATKEALRHMLREGILPVYDVKGREHISEADIDKLWRENKRFLTPDT